MSRDTSTPDSLCESCQNMREVTTPKGSRFLLCQLSLTDARYPKYPPQPVVRCQGYQSTESEDSGGDIPTKIAQGL